MKLESFRELLLKKCNDSDLENLIHFVREDVLANLVIESLEKMARAGHKGDSANLAVRHFATEMDPQLEPHMIHDALSHHASHYKAALKAGDKALADKHAKSVFKIMDMADQAQKHSNGKLHVEAVSPHAWERNGKTKTFTADDEPVKRGSKKVGQFVTDTKGWRYRGNDYSFLQQAPHSHYKNEIRKHRHNNAYPMEHIQINGKYLDVRDIPKDQLSAGESHPFDHHPVMQHFETPVSKRTPKDDEAYLNSLDMYHSSPHMERYFDSQEKMQQENPDAHANRGKSRSLPVHDPVEPLNLDEEVGAPAKPVAAAQPSKVAEQQAAETKPSQVKTRKKGEKSPEELLQLLNSPQYSDLPDYAKKILAEQIKQKIGKKDE